MADAPARRARLLGARTVRLQLAVAAVIGAVTTTAWAVSDRHYFWPRWVYFGVCTALTAEYLIWRALAVPSRRRRWLQLTGSAAALFSTVDVVVWSLSGGGFFWPIATVPGFTTVFAVHAWIVNRLPPERERELTERVDALARTRRGALEGQAAQLKRIERDLHDGAQARMVSLALHLGMAEDLVRRDPDAAVQLLSEARATAVSALDDLRTVMQGIQPAVLADRGLVGGIRALALDLALPVTVSGDVPDGLPDAVESAAYFATAECLANAVKHSQARTGWVVFGYHDETLTVTVGDDGIGGADPLHGSGLRGVQGRLDPFDGTLRVQSPTGGPTLVTIGVTAALEDPDRS